MFLPLFKGTKVMYSNSSNYTKCLSECANLYSMLNDSKDVINSVRRDDVWRLSASCFTSHYSLLSRRCWGEILNLRNTLTPAGVDTSLVLTPTRITPSCDKLHSCLEARGNPRQAKTGEVSNDFLGEN